MKPVLYLIIPCYRDEDTLPITYVEFDKKISELINKKIISSKSKILLVDDGSSDNTWNVIKRISSKNKRFVGYKLSTNMGHQYSLMAGLTEATNKCDICISMDSDGQDDINVIDKMVNEYLKGNEIVYGVRSNRESDSLFKKSTAETFYKLMSLLGTKTIFNHADCRLVSNRVLNELLRYQEVNLYLRGLFPLLGFKSSTVEYKRLKRVSGEGHYTLSKLFALAFDGITSLTIKPIRLITILGFLISFMSFVLIIYIIICKITGKVVLEGWSSMICIVCLLSGIQMVSIGIIGEYIGKVYLETKKRPRYIIEERTEKN